MLTHMRKILDEARKGKYGIPAPTIWDERSIRASLEAAVECRSPIILDYHKDWGRNEIFENGTVFDLINCVDIPVALQQDHGFTFEENMWAIHAGFPAIMVDRSSLPSEENIAKTKEIVRIAHSVNIYVEAECGHVGMEAGYTASGSLGTGEDDKTILTDPEQARKYVEATGIDSLTISIGSKHGLYKGKPKFDFERLQKIRDLVSVPLVVHGASGISYKDMSKLAELGMSKFNMQTYLSEAAKNSVKKHLEKNKENPDVTTRLLKRISEEADNGWKEELKNYIRAIKSEGKAAK